jgi:glycosyltransferase involved in cell wall biosynthesis
MSISLYSFIKNEENCLTHMIESVKDFVDEIVIVDTGSQDGSLEIAKQYNARIYEVGFSDFGKIRTLASHLCRGTWVLGLDADETLESPELLKKISTLGNDAYAFPRKRWLDLETTQQTEVEAYPDWQVRFYRNNPQYTWKRELHEYFDGCAVAAIPQGPIIHHFQDVYHNSDPIRQQEKLELYTRLAKKAGVTVSGGKEVK